MTALLDRVDSVLRWSLLALATAMIATVTWQVVSRYALQTPSSLTEEIARFQLIWLGLLGAVYAFRNRAHVGIDILLVSIGGRLRVAAELLVLAFSAVFAGSILVFGGVNLVSLTFELEQTSAALGIKMAYVYAVIPVSGAFICLYCICFMFDAVRSYETRSPNDSD